MPPTLRVGGTLLLKTDYDTGLTTARRARIVALVIDYAVNIKACFDRALFCERLKGEAWYREAHALALELSPGDVWRGAGVISALSPLKQWPVNVRLARLAFSTGEASGQIGIHTRNAQRILDGEFALDVLNGPKTRSFAEAIATGGQGSIATIDRHAHDIAMARVFTDNERKIGKIVYRDMASAYSEVAEYVGLSVNAVQAITWVTWKREKGHK